MYMYMHVYVCMILHTCTYTHNVHVTTCIRIHRSECIKVNTHLDRSSQYVSIVRQPSGKGRTIIEGVPWPILGLLERGLEGVELLPQLKDLLLLGWEVELIRHWTHHDDTAAGG